jgi:glycerol-3-phosphate dehydrogenase (NAD(P)+)
VELAGALKNIYAIASGMAAALGLGENARALLLTRSLAEMSRFAVQLGANPLTFIGLAGMGDLMVTCTSPLSRNYRVGEALGQGYSLRQAVKQLGETAEGINTLRMVKLKSDAMGVSMPIVEALHAIIEEQADVEHLAKRLMLGERASDVEFMIDAEALR